MSMLKTLIGAAAAVAMVQASSAAVVWDEAISGDLSGSAASPTLVAVAAGSNQVIGTTGDVGAGTDLDYFTIVVPAGHELSSLFLLPVTAPDSLAFIGVQAGPAVTATGAAALLGWVHYSAADAGTDILPRMGAGAGAIGFAGPLPAGTYSFWVQDFDPGVSPYGFDLQVTAVPEPSSALALMGGLLVLAARRRRRWA